MPVHHATARKLTTKAEWALLETSFAGAITALTPARLRQQMARARKLRDKYRDLARQQRGEARGKRKARSSRAARGNANTVVKREIFADALERFEKRLARLDAKATKAAASTARPAKAKARAGPRPPKQPAGDRWGDEEAATAGGRRAHSAASRGARKQQKLKHQSARAHQGHVGSRGRRNQARRDRR